MADIIDINDYLEREVNEKEEKMKMAHLFSETFWKLDAKINEADEVFINEAMKLLTHFGAGSPQVQSLMKIVGTFQFLLLVAKTKSLGEERACILLDQAVKRMAE